MLAKSFLQAFVVLVAARGAAAAAIQSLAARQTGLFQRPIRGVNLGGWLVLEPWITPSIFEEAGENAVDEFTLSQILGAGAQARLQRHWNSFITAADFGRIASAGMNHVRIPIGYWALIRVDGDPYVQGQLEYMDRALDWAKAAGLKVIIDLHGAPGSQNGFDNSGRRGPVLWQTGDTVARTLQAVRVLTERYAKRTDVVTGIELLNEPNANAGVQIDPLKQFYYDGWGITRESDPNTGVVISDAFKGVTFWNGFMGPGSGVNNVILDVHYYQVFDVGALRQNADQHVGSACGFGHTIAQGDKWTITGEWSGALTDCAKYLNGRGRGARWDGTYENNQPLGSCAGKSVGNVAALPQAEKDNIRKFIEAQLNAFEKGVGWFFWTWRTEGAPEWDMGQLLEAGVFPRPLDSRVFVHSC